MSESADLRTFVRVVERGRFSAASNDLGITPSAVGKLVCRATIWKRTAAAIRA
jgi:DNA-binding transcriptional LysR family regulator